MCGRVTIATKKKILEEQFKAKFNYDFSPRYNVAPTQTLPVITNEEPKAIQGLHWGLHPVWIKSVMKSGGIINVRMENLRDKRTFKGDLKNRRCLILVDGFYEWQAQKKGPKVPYLIRMKNKKPFAFAGLWEDNEFEGGEKVRTFAIITTGPNKVLEPIHHRMPVVLSKDEQHLWLNESNPEFLINILDPYPEKEMEAYEVSRAVNTPVIDEPKLLEPVVRSG